jgi:hypothetical protein
MKDFFFEAMKDSDWGESVCKDLENIEDWLREKDKNISP